MMDSVESIVFHHCLILWLSFFYQYIFFHFIQNSCKRNTRSFLFEAPSFKTISVWNSGFVSRLIKLCLLRKSFFWRILSSFPACYIKFCSSLHHRKFLYLSLLKTRYFQFILSFFYSFIRFISSPSPSNRNFPFFLFFYLDKPFKLFQLLHCSLNDLLSVGVGSFLFLEQVDWSSCSLLKLGFEHAFFWLLRNQTEK